MQKRNDDQQLSQNKNDILEQGTGTIDTCTMDPCPMKTKSKGDHTVKCPDCGKTEKPEAA